MEGGMNRVVSSFKEETSFLDAGSSYVCATLFLHFGSWRVEANPSSQTEVEWLDNHAMIARFSFLTSVFVEEYALDRAERMR